MVEKKISEKQRQNTEEKQQNSLNNLVPWKPGQSGNPAGRPPSELSITSGLRDKIDEVPGQAEGVDNPRGLTWRDLIIERVVKRAAIEGEPRLTQQLLDRLEGPVTQRIETSKEMEQLRSACELQAKLLANRQRIGGQSDADEGQGES